MSRLTIHSDVKPKANESDACCGPTCCGGEQAKKSAEAVALTATVREKYGRTAESSLSNDDAGVRVVAEAFGYSPEQLASIPAEANMGLSCGNPTAMASLKPGEVVVDLGSGGGLDVFLAAEKVGPTGKAIGIDMTEAMVERARRNAAKYPNVEFRLAQIDQTGLPDASVDVVISNCVINLAPNKRSVFREIARILKPSGRIAVSDIALKKPLPPQIARDVMAYVGCIAGAILIEDYIIGLREAGLEHVQVVDANADLNAYTKVEGQAGCCSPSMDSPAGSGCCTPSTNNPTIHNGLTEVLKKYDVNEYAASVKVYATNR